MTTPATGKWFALARTHVAVVLRIDEELLLADAGFGVKQPLGIVPIGDDEGVRAPHGRHRVVAGVLDSEWMLQCEHDGGGCLNTSGFSRHDEVADPAALDAIRDLIVHRAESVFNRGPLIALQTEHGRFVLGPSGLTEIHDGLKNVVPLEPKDIETVSRMFLRRPPADAG